MKIYYEDNHLLVVKKECNILSQADNSKDKDMLSLAKDYIKVSTNKPGNVYLGLVHRLDRPVSGVMVFAKTSKSASRLSDQIRRNTWDKYYLAVVEGHPKKGQYVDYLYKDRNTNTSYVVKKDHKDAKKAILEVLSVDYDEANNLSLVHIKLITGRSHQIRVQFASRQTPLWGDARYNKHAVPGEQIALFASELAIDHPTLKKRLVFKDKAPDNYPFTLW